MSSTTTSRIIDNLNAEWRDLLSTGTFADRVDEWICRWPGIEVLREDALPANSQRIPPEQADAIFHTLLVEHAEGDYPAGRVVLQCMLPAAVTVAARGGGGIAANRATDFEERIAVAIAGLWSAITTYDLTKTSKVASTLKYRTLEAVAGREVTRPRVAEVPLAPDDLELYRDRQALSRSHDAHPMRADLGPVGEVLEVILWGVNVQAITSAEATLLTRLYAPDPDLPEYAELERSQGTFQKRVAEEMGIPFASMRQRAHRAVRKLAKAIENES